MTNTLERLKQVLDSGDVWLTSASIAIALCTIVLVFAVLIDFVLFHKPAQSKKKRRSWVETGSMFGYFFFYFLLMLWDHGKLSATSDSMRHWLIAVGTSTIVVGCWVNVAGRFALNDNWANQVTIYRHQTLVTKGVYRFVRHPLYASIIWMLLGGCLVYLSVAALVSVVLLFVPMMHYRAKQEEQLLKDDFPAYHDYQKRAGRFFPKLYNP